MKTTTHERITLTFRAKLLLAFTASALIAGFLLFAAGNYYINVLQRRNVQAAIELAQEQARQLAREIVDLMREEQQSTLHGGNLPEKLKPLTQIVLRQNKRIVWAGIFDPATGAYVIEQTNENQQTFKTRSVDGSPYRTQLPVNSRTPLEVMVQSNTGTAKTHEIQHPIEQQGKPIGEIHLKIAASEPFIRIEATSQQITYALVVQAALLFVFFLGVFWIVWRLVLRHLEIVKKTTELEQMAYVGTLASGLAHEIRNPLNAMNINLQMAMEDLMSSEQVEHASQVRALLSRVQAEITQLNQTLSSFLEFALPSRESITRFSVKSLVEELVATYEPLAKELGVTIEINSPDSSETVIEADRRLFYQALRNVLLNAIQAVSNSVRRHIEIAIQAQRDTVTVTVTDSGPGIPPDQLSRIFDAFYTTRKGGTGLGLAITRKIVEEHGGHISAQNVDSRGACFKITMPRESKLWSK